MTSLLALARKAVPVAAPAPALPDLGFPPLTRSTWGAPAPTRPPEAAPTGWAVPGLCPSCAATLPGLLIVAGTRRFSICPRCHRWIAARRR